MYNIYEKIYLRIYISASIFMSISIFNPPKISWSSFSSPSSQGHSRSYISPCQINPPHLAQEPLVLLLQLGNLRDVGDVGITMGFSAP